MALFVPFSTDADVLIVGRPPAGTGISNHAHTAMPAIKLCGEQKFHFALLPGPCLLVFAKLILHGCKQLLSDDGGHTALYSGVPIFVHADISFIP